MPDSKKLRGKADRSRVALQGQRHERQYLIERIEQALGRLEAQRHFASDAEAELENALARLRAGFPAAKPRRGARKAGRR